MKFVAAVVITIFISLQISLYLGKQVGVNEARTKIESLEHKIDSLRIENQRLQNDVDLWKDRYEISVSDEQ